MVKRQVVFWVDEDILRAFDDWRMERRLPSRAAAFVEVMMEKTAQTPPPAIREVRAAVDRVAESEASGALTVRQSFGRGDQEPIRNAKQVACAHPNKKRLPNYGVWKCEDCGDTWK